jgi:radical SAM superfamily enzyme YgiQ (UPF0313 family)
VRILFVFTLTDVQSPSRPLRTPEYIQLGLSYLSSYLKAHGHETRLVVLSRLFAAHNAEMMRRAAAEFAPGLLAFYSVSSEYPFVKEVSREFRGLLPAVPQILGGPHASLAPAHAIEDFDALCLGEGEDALLEYVTQLDGGRPPIGAADDGKSVSGNRERAMIQGIANLWIKHSDGRIERHAPRAFCADIDRFPFPDRELWERWIEEEPGSKPTVMLGRGCPFQCTYCAHHVLRTLGSGTYVRFRAPAKIVEEIKELAKRWPHHQEIYLEQETIGVNVARSVELFEALAELNRRRTSGERPTANAEQPTSGAALSIQPSAAPTHPLTFGVNLAVSPGIDYETLFAAMKRANVRYVNMGLESGSERLRREVLRRRYSNEDLLLAVRTAKKHGLQVALYNMIGLPTETPEDFWQTVNMNRECEPNWNYTSIFYPCPGTDLYRMCQEQGLLEGATNGDGVVHIDMERSQATLDLPTFPRKQIQKAFVWFDYHVYRGRRPWLKLMAKVLRRKIMTNPRLNYVYRAAARSGLVQWVIRLIHPAPEQVSHE